MASYKFLIGVSNVQKFGLCFSCCRHFSGQELELAKKVRTSLKVGTKKPSRKPFMKEVFLGNFDPEMLVYPELDNERLQELKKRIEPFKDYIQSNVDIHAISSLKMVPNKVTQDLKNLGLFGQLIPLEYGGCDQTAVETTYISEITAKDLNIALTLYSHNFLGVQTLLSYGNQQQKEKYLPRMALGEITSAFCFSEDSSGSDLLTTLSKFLPSEDPNLYILNGKKKWVINGNCANVFIVLAKVDHQMYQGKTIPVIRIALVDKNSHGVTISQPQENLGLHASNICEVHFKDTPVRADCFLGNETQGFEMSSQILNSGRYNIGAITISLLKNLLNKAVDFIISRKQFEKPLMDSEAVQGKIADIATCIYTLESMTYHTALILDEYENPDCSLELAIIKIYSFTEGRRCLDLLTELMGGRAFSDSEEIQTYFRDFRTMEMFDGTTDIAKLFVVLTGLQYAGVTMNETVAKLRFPFEYPNFVVKRLFTQRRQMSDNPKLSLNLYEMLHPSLQNAANDLEYCVHRLPFAISQLLARYGSDVVNQQTELMRLADAAVKIYAMTTILARSSRSYCIGIHNAESELKYAVTLCTDYKKVVQEELNQVIEGIIATGDLYSFKFGPNVIKNHGYFLEHPLERTY